MRKIVFLIFCISVLLMFGAAVSVHHQPTPLLAIVLVIAFIVALLTGVWSFLAWIMAEEKKVKARIRVRDDG